MVISKRKYAVLLFIILSCEQITKERDTERCIKSKTKEIFQICLAAKNANLVECLYIWETNKKLCEKGSD